MDVEKEVRFFDQFEAEHGDYDVLTEGAYDRLLGVIEKQIRPQPGWHCVDLGCGTGAFTRRLARFQLELTGIDISPRSIERANAQGGGRFLVGDISQCTLPTASCDLVVMSGVLHHIPKKAIRVQCLREARRILRPGAYFFSYDPNASSPSMFLFRDPRSPLYSSVGKTENEVLLTDCEIHDDLEDSGFSDIGIRGLSGITYRFVEGRLPMLVLPLYNAIYEPLIRFSPFENLLGTFLTAVARKAS